VVYVEDTYGVEFHRVLLEKLAESKVLQSSNLRPVIRRMPAKKCNQALYKKIMGYLIRYQDWRVLIVIDSEHRGAKEAAESDVLRHFRRWRDRVKVAVVEPMHEAWLCIGLCGSPRRCRNDPIGELSHRLGRPYEKRYLARLAKEIDINKLRGEHDFEKYVEQLNWLLGIS